MTDTAIRVVGAGWYEDPADVGRVRWWNGVAWTEHTNPKPGLESAQVAAALTGAIPTVSAPAATAPAAIEAGASTAAVAPTAETAPLTRRQAIEAEGGRSATEPTRGQTGAVWLLALLPVIAFVLALAGGYVYYYVVTSPLVALVALVPYALGILWALSDSRQLAARGFRAPSPWWALLTPLGYLIARRTRVPGTGAILLFAITAVLTVALPAGLVLSGATRSVTLALQIQHDATSEFVGSGLLKAVSCPPIVESTTPGTVFTCQATAADGTPTQVWVSIDSADGTFSLAPAV
jgi:hypothetical protein